MFLLYQKRKRSQVSTSPQPSPYQGEGEIQSVSHGTPKEDVSRETPEYDIIEVTPYRLEAKYSDFRHPDEVKFSDNLEDDLKRRDFTLNAMAFSSKGQLIDLYKGQEDIKDKVLRTLRTVPTKRTETPRMKAT